MVELRKRRVDDLRRHEVREDFLEPHVVEPAHGHEVAEPHVRGLVRDHRRPAEQLVLGGRLVQQQAGRVVEDGAGMLHAAELERGDRDEVELAERIGNRRVVLEPGKRRGVQVEDRVAVARDLRRRRSRGGTCGTCGRCARRSPPRTRRRRRRRDRSGSAESRQIECGDRRRRPPHSPRHRWRRPATPSEWSARAKNAPSGPAGRSRETRGAPVPARTACTESRDCGSAAASPDVNAISTVFSPRASSFRGTTTWSVTSLIFEGPPLTATVAIDPEPAVKSSTSGPAFSFSSKRMTAWPVTGSVSTAGIENDSS